MSVAATCLVTPPPVPVTVNVFGFFLALLVTVTVRVDDAPAATTVGLSEGVTPVAAPLTLKVTFEVNAPTGVTVTIKVVVVVVPAVGRVADFAAGAKARLKVGPLLVSGTLVECAREPLVAVMGIV